MDASIQQAVQSQITPAFCISIAALILSALSPFASAIISGHFRLKEKKMDLDAEEKRRRQQFYDQHRAEVIEAYITAVGSVARGKNYSDVVEYGKSMGEIYLYADESLWPLLDSISEKITRNRSEDVTEELKELCKKLSRYEVRSEKKYIPDDHEKCAVKNVSPKA